MIGPGTLVPLLASALVAPSEDGVLYLDASIEVTGELLGASFFDLDEDRQEEIALVVKAPDGTRELRLHRLTEDGLCRQPFRIVPVLAGAIAYGFADVREEPGAELFFLAKGGAWSLSLEREGYRNNLARLVETELLYDVSHPDELPFWEYVIPKGGGDWILLPGPTEYSIWAPRNAGASEGAYRTLASFPGAAISDRPTPKRGKQVRFEGGSFQTEAAGLPAPFLEDRSEGTGAFLSNERSFPAPALLDLNGDGALDLLRLDSNELSVYFGGKDAPGEGPDRQEALPAYIPAENAEFEFIDLDCDGDLDLIVRSEEDSEGLENSEIELILLLNDGTRLFPESPDQVLRFEAAVLALDTGDIDGDGRPDIALRKFELPSLLDVVSGVEFTLTYLLYFGQTGPRPFDRKPTLKQSQKYDETTVGEAMKNRIWRADCDGDGLGDLVEVDLEGRISIRRLRHSKSFFGGDSWTLEEAPWRRFETHGNVEELELRDLNGDGLADIISPTAEGLTLLLSRRRGR